MFDPNLATLQFNVDQAIKRIQYKSNFKIVADLQNSDIKLTIMFGDKCSDKPTLLKEHFKQFFIPGYWFLSENDFIHWVWDRVCETERLIAEDWFKVDGQLYVGVKSSGRE